MKKKLLFASIIAFLSIVLMAPILIGVASAATVYSDGFESGVLSTWTVTYGALSVNTQIVHGGTYSVQNNVVGGVENLYYRFLGSSLPNPIFLREYIYINSTSVPTASGDYYEVGGFSTTQGGNFGDGEICVINVGGTLYWGVYYVDTRVPGFSFSISTTNSTATAHPVTIGWHSVELKEITGTSGEIQLFLDGVSILDVVGINNSIRIPVNVVLGGSQHATDPNQKWNYYIDDMVVSDSYIGPSPFLLSTSTNFGTDVTPSSGPFPEFSTVTITATPPVAAANERYIWIGWLGSGIGSYSGSNNPATVTMGSAISEQAVWEHDYYLTVSSPNGTTSGSGWYMAGTTGFASVAPTTVAGPAGTQYVFTNWSGDASGTSSPSDGIVMNAPKTAIANWKTQYYLNVSSVNGTVGGSGWYDALTNATATVSPLIVAGSTGTQYVFTNWSVDATGTSSPSNPINMTTPKNAIANWKTQYNVTFTQSGVGTDFTGTVVTVNGTAYGRAGFSAWANSGDVYIFNYSSPLTVTANSKMYPITGVSGNSTALSVTASQPVTVTAAYKTQYYLAVSSAYGIPTPASGWFDSGTTIIGSINSSVPAGSGTQYFCAGWSGVGSVPASGSSSPVTFTINAPSNITWNWQTQYYLAVSSVNGTVGGAGWYNAGSSAYASVTSTTEAGTTGTQYVFTSWSGDASGSSSPSDAIVMNAPKTATANWKTQYYLTTVSAYGSPTPANGWFDSGTSINGSVAGSSVSGGSGIQYVCTGWSGVGSVPATGSSSAVTFTINAPSTVTWTWKTQYLVSFVVSPAGMASVSPSGDLWSDSGSVSISATPNVGGTFSSWSSSTGNITIGNSLNRFTTANINGPGTVTANIATTSTNSPTPTPSHSATPTPKPTATASPTAKPASPTPTPSSGPTQNFNAAPYIYGTVIAIVIVAILSSFMLLRKTKAKKGLS